MFSSNHCSRHNAATLWSVVLFSSGAGVQVASRPRGRGVRSEPGVTFGARGPQRWRGTGSGARGPQARNQSVPTHKFYVPQSNILYRSKRYIQGRSCLLIAFNTKTHTFFSLMGTNLSNWGGSKRSMYAPSSKAGKSGYTAEVKFTTANERYDPQLQGVGCWVLLVVET